MEQENLHDEENHESDNDNDNHDDKKKGNGFEKRIKKLNKKISAAEEEANYWRSEAMKAKTQPNAQTQNVSQYTSTDASAKPILSQYNNVEEYTEALTEWKVEQKLKQKEQQQYQTKNLDTYNQRVNAFKEKTPDYEKVVARTSDWATAPEISQAIVESDIGPEIVYFLAQNKAELDRVNSLSSHKRFIEMGKIEDKLIRQAKKEARAAEDNKSMTKNVSKAPQPLSATNGKKNINLDASSESISDKEWRLAREAQLREKHSRR